MRKQTKVVAVASAAALLAIGASMTSFAATGWVEEDGVWYFYDKDGNRVEDEWKKSGDNWYWLDSEEGGAMAIDKLVEDDNNIYYVDSNGVMVRNTWVKVVNEDQDEDDDPAEYNYYYMQSNGKAYKAPDSSSSTKFRTIDGKRYAFDNEGKMLYGWVDGDSGRLTGDDGWASPTDSDAETDKKVYYLGNWDDGSMKTGWQKITVYDEKEEEDMDYWFWFKSNGVKFTAKEGSGVKADKSINKTKYGFDERGVMVYQWTNVATDSDAVASVSSWQYFSDPESGARVSKGWFRVVAPLDANDNTFQDYGGTFAAGDADDENERWYYADDGELYEGEIKKIKGKYYAFYPDGHDKAGAMLSGLVLLEMDGKAITSVIDDGVDSDELNDLMDGKYKIPDGVDSDNVFMYYFGDDELSDGAMKTGSTTINIDGDSYQFMFSKTGGAESKGRGINGINDKKYVYKYGLKLKASTDDKYRVVYVDDETVETVDRSELRSKATLVGTNKGGDPVKFVGKAGEGWKAEYKLLNTSGAIVQRKSAAKDGDDWYFYVKEKNIIAYVNTKDLKSEGNMDVNFDKWNNWKLNGSFDPFTNEE